MNNQTIRHEVEVDTRIAALYQEAARASYAIGNDIDSIHRYAGDKQADSYAYQGGRRVRVSAWGMTLAEALAAPVQGYYVRYHQDAITKLTADRAEMKRINTALDLANAEYTGWSRFFIVRGGHIHSSQSCQSCFPTTEFGWLPDLSGLTEADAVAAHGPLLCTFCYPSAPVEWTVGPSANKTYCAGSGQYVEGAGRRSYGKCPECKKLIALAPSTGVIRKHPPITQKEIDKRNIEATKHYAVKFIRPDGSSGTHTERMTQEKAAKEAAKIARDYGAGWKGEVVDLDLVSA